MKKALCVGINNYKNYDSLDCCVADAKSVAEVLKTNEDESQNFDVRCLTAENNSEEITKELLEYQIEQLFKGDVDVALFYFAGHGTISGGEGFLLTSEVETESDGFSFNKLHQLASVSQAKNIVIILDCCYSGIAGNPDIACGSTSLREGMTILTACSRMEEAEENDTHGVFTALLLEALKGGAMNLTGVVTPGSVYSYVDLALGPWDQRPMFKSNVKNFIPLRKNTPPISMSDLHKITELFVYPEAEFKLDPTYEPKEEDVYNPENGAKFKILQRYNHVNLVVPVDVEHMYYAAIENKSCKLTALGKYYWKLVKSQRI